MRVWAPCSPLWSSRYTSLLRYVDAKHTTYLNNPLGIDLLIDLLRISGMGLIGLEQVSSPVDLDKKHLVCFDRRTVNRLTCSIVNCSLFLAESKYLICSYLFSTGADEQNRCWDEAELDRTCAAKNSIVRLWPDWHRVCACVCVCVREWGWKTETQWHC